MKTTNRTHRNGSAPRAAKQAPKKPEAHPAKNRAAHSGEIKWFDSEKEIGFITIAPELTKKLKIPPEVDLFFSQASVVGFNPRRLMAGDKVSFLVKKSGRCPRAVKVSVLESLAEKDDCAALQRGQAQASAQRYFENGKFKEVRFVDETSNLMSHEGTELRRDLDGRLFLLRFDDEQDAAQLCEVSFATALRWVTQNSMWRDPEKFLAFHGITRPKEFSSVEFEGAVQQSVALLELLEHRMIYDEAGSEAEPFAGVFHGGILELTKATQKRLMAVQDDYFASAKGGAR